MRAAVLYSLLPVEAQNLALSGYGLLLHRRRYGPEGRRWLNGLLQSQWDSLEELRARQLAAVRAIVDHAYLTVPFYRERYGAIGYRPGEIRTLEDLRHLPILEKDHVRIDPWRFLSSEVARRRIIVGHTSGTSGTPLTTLKTRESYQRNWAFLERVRIWFGIPRRSPRVSLGLRTVVPLFNERPPFWRVDRYTNNWLFSIHHMTDENLPAYVRKIAEIEPLEINGHPSCIAIVAAAALRVGETRIRPKAVLTSAETLLEGQRATIENAFQCAVRDQYGSAENVVWISQCEQGNYHEHLEYGFLEVLRGDKPVIDEPGEVVATGVLNRAMPLIRYRLGDALVRSEEQGCACGRAFPMVREILGRTDDVLHTPQGRPVARVSGVFKELRNVKESQVIQHAVDQLTVLVVAAGPIQEDLGRINSGLTTLFGPGMKLDIKVVDAIPRTETGKFLFQRNLVGKVAKGSDVRSG